MEWLYVFFSVIIFLFSFFKLTSNTTFTNLAEQISRIEPPYPHDWLPYSSSEELLGSSAPDVRHRYSASEEDDEDEEEESLVRVRPRTGSLSEHEDLLALKAQAQAVIRREETGYDVSTLFCVNIDVVMLSSKNDTVHSIKKTGTSFPRLPIFKGKALGTRNENKEECGK